MENFILENPGATDQDHENALTDAEKWAIKNYTRDMFEPINDLLAGKVVDEHAFDREFLEKQIDDMTKALDKLKAEHTWAGEAFRGDAWHEESKYRRNFEMFLTAQIGDEPVTWKPFMSTSKDKGRAFGFARLKVFRMKYIIEGAGISIAHLSGFKDEKEVLFKPSSKFKVTSMDEVQYEHYTETIVRIKQILD